MAIVVFTYKDFLFRTAMTESQSITIGSGKKDTLFVKELLPAQITGRFEHGLLLLTVKKSALGKRFQLSKDTIQTLDENGFMKLQWVESDQNDTCSIPIKYGHQIWKLGRSIDNDIVIARNFISRHQLSFQIVGNHVFVDDGLDGVPSTNGTFLNGNRINCRQELAPGDVIDIMAVRITLNNAALSIENAGESLNATKIGTGDLYISSQRLDSARPKYHRSPRLDSELPSETITLAKPPSAPPRAGKHRGMFSSLLTGGAMIAASAATGTLSPALLAMRGASLISPIVNGVSGHKQDSQNRKATEADAENRYLKYSSYIEEQKAAIGRIADEQRGIINSENPAPLDCMGIVQELTNSLWERTPQDRDFLTVRVGMGYENLCVEVTAPKESSNFQMESDELERLCRQIISETEIVDNIASLVPMRQYGTIGVIGQRDKVVSQIRNMIVSLVTLHFYKDIRIVGFFDEEEKAQWEALRWLPHVWDRERQIRFLSFLPGNARRENGDGLESYFKEMLEDELANARNREWEAADSFPTYYLFLIASDRFQEHSDLCELLLGKQEQLPIATIFLREKMIQLPHGCKYVIDMDDATYPSIFAVKSANKKRYFTPDPPLNLKEFDMFCRNMSAIEVMEKNATAEIPGSITFLQGMGVSNVQELDAWERWSSSRPEEGLAAPFAMMRGNMLFGFDLVHQGPHGLIAGTTGSGKSELITSWLLSLAVNYKPEDIAFVIIDYKGGGLANTFDGLPHLLGKITNLDEDIYRPMISLYAELERRQKLFNEAGVNEIRQYAIRFREGKVPEPLPRLLIVVDEFRELRSKEPDFLKSLISIATLGRSLGIHLVLSTQSPNGIVDEQIRNNANFSICLKVKNVSDSKDMLGRSDAATITQSGRAYVKIGNDESFSLVQSFWSGAPYLGHIGSEESGGNSVRVVTIEGERLKTVSDEKTRFKSDITELKAVIRYISDVAAQHPSLEIRRPWKMELPKRLHLSELEFSGFDGTRWNGAQPWLKFPIGKYDIPQQQDQNVLYLDLEDGHYAIYGASGTGKTTLLRTILTAAGLCFTPEDIQIYILDFGGWSMKTFQGMPHVGDVALDHETDKVQKLAALLEREIQERKEKFSACGISSLRVYRQKVSADTPAILVAVDNFAPVFQAYPEYERLMLKIIQEGASLGIYLVYTANSQTGIPYKLINNMKNAITFEPSDKGDYALVGKPVVMKDMPPRPLSLPKVRGRAYFKGAAPIMFQAALSRDGADDLMIADKLRELFDAMNAAWNGPRPERLPVLPDSVTVEMLAADYFKPTVIPVGLKVSSITSATLELREKYIALFAGTTKNVAGTLCATAWLIHRRFPDVQFYLLDNSSEDLSVLSSITTRYAGVKDTEMCNSIISELFQNLVLRQEQRDEFQNEHSEPSDMAAWVEQLPLICLLIADAPELTEHIAGKSLQMIENIARLAKGLGLVILAGGTPSGIDKYQSERQLIHSLVLARQGVIVSGSAAMHFGYFTGNMGYVEKNANLAEGFGWLYQNGKFEQIKLIRE